jgi:glutamate-ammonia-ligase adenylyltransferase
LSPPSSTPCCTTARGSAGDGARTPCRTCGTGPLPVDSETLLERLPPVLATRLRSWVQQPRVQALRDESRLRLGRLMQKTAQVLQEEGCTEAGALRFVDWVEPLLRRESYLALLVERSEVHAGCCVCWAWRAGPCST